MNELGGYEFKELCVGMSATYAKTITEADIVLFAAVSGDNNAIHNNEEFAATTIFKGRIAGLVHGCRGCEGAADRIGRRPVPDRCDRSTPCRTSTMPTAVTIFPRSSTGCATGGSTRPGCAGAGR